MYSVGSKQYANNDAISGNHDSTELDNENDQYDTQSQGFQVLREGSEGKFSDAIYVGEGLQRTSGVSDFNDVDCGEPATGQHLRISFAFTEEDNVELENKCRSFWKFIRSHPHLERIKIMPIGDNQSSLGEEIPVVKRNVSTDATKTAMQWMQHGDILQSAMRTKLKKSICDFNNGDYCEGRKKRRNTAKIPSSRLKGVEDKSGGSSRVPSADKLEVLYKCMEEWDAMHPRCMDPPGAVDATI